MWVWAFCGTSQLFNEQSLVTSVCEQGHSDFRIASLFDCAMPSVSRCNLDKPNVDSVILQSNTVSK